MIAGLWAVEIFDSAVAILIQSRSNSRVHAVPDFGWHEFRMSQRPDSKKYRHHARRYRCNWRDDAGM